MGGSVQGWPSYPAREATAARASGAEVTMTGQDAATALDRPRFLDGEPIIPETRQRPRYESAPSGRLAPMRGAAIWALLLLVGVVGGAAGAVFGIWLAWR